MKHRLQARGKRRLAFFMSWPLAMMLLLTSLAFASHTEIWREHVRWQPYNAWNGFKVFLSSPRHASSRSRGECLAVGYEENINGRRFGWFAGTGSYYMEKWDTRSRNRNLRGRGYKVTLSKNTRDNGFLQNRTASENWGSDVHLTIHSNAEPGARACEGTTNYVLTMYRSDRARSRNLAAKLVQVLDPVVPGGQNSWAASDFELYTRARHVAYLELAFHTKRSSQRWLGTDSRLSAWRIGYAIDQRLGYPR